MPPNVVRDSNKTERLSEHKKQKTPPRRVAGTAVVTACNHPLSSDNTKMKEGKTKKKKLEEGKDKLFLKILHYNCQGLAGEARLYEFKEALGKINWDVLGISEIRRVRKNWSKGKMGTSFIISDKQRDIEGWGSILIKSGGIK